jgi:hypothetical protein
MHSPVWHMGEELTDAYLLHHIGMSNLASPGGGRRYILMGGNHKPGPVPRAMVQNHCTQIKAVLGYLLPNLQSQQERERKTAILLLIEVRQGRGKGPMKPMSPPPSTCLNSRQSPSDSPCGDSFPDGPLPGLQRLLRPLSLEQEGGVMRGGLGEELSLHPSLPTTTRVKKPWVWTHQTIFRCGIILLT